LGIKSFFSKKKTGRVQWWEHEPGKCGPTAEAGGFPVWPNFMLFSFGPVRPVRVRKISAESIRPGLHRVDSAASHGLPNLAFAVGSGQRPCVIFIVYKTEMERSVLLSERDIN
jgi:hypothetical protein